jgi:hypothetical protein
MGASRCQVSLIACVTVFSLSTGLDASWCRTLQQGSSRGTSQAATSIEWLRSYAGSNTNRLVWDTRFEPFLSASLPDIRVDFWGGKPLAEVAAEYLGGPPDQVRLEEGRYLSAGACVYKFGPAKGLLWVDLGQKPALVVFAALRGGRGGVGGVTWDSPAVWIVSQKALTADTLPKPLLGAITRWITDDREAVRLRPIKLTLVEVVDPTGRIQTTDPAALGLPAVK